MTPRLMICFTESGWLSSNWNVTRRLLGQLKEAFSTMQTMLLAGGR